MLFTTHNFSSKSFHNISYLSKIYLFLHLVIFINLSCFSQTQNNVITISPNSTVLMTGVIQEAINKCATTGGGIVHLTSGTFICGGLELKSNVTLRMVSGTILQGSNNYKDYNNDAFIFGENISNISIEGEGVIDGVDCVNQKGEEGFRGPHCIRLINCKNITIKGIKIINSGNWAISCRYCSNAKVENVVIRGGHDGLHTRFCDSFNVQGCDFRTGDDAFAGNDNRDFTITNCKVNTSCNGFRMGCYNLSIKGCTIWGPGEFVHKSQKRNNMLSAFVHFSPADDAPKLLSGNWTIEDVTIDQVDHVYMYNFRDGLWQTGQPVTSIQFKNVKASGILNAFNITGDSLMKFNLKVVNSSFSFREGAVFTDTIFEGSGTNSNSFIYARNFNSLHFQNVTINNFGSNQTFEANSGKAVCFKKVKFNSTSSEPYKLTNIPKTTIRRTRITVR